MRSRNILLSILLPFAIFAPRLSSAAVVNMGSASTEFTRLLYKAPATPPTSPLSSVLAVAQPVAYGAINGFKGVFTPYGFGATVGASIVAYGIGTALNELRVQAGTNVQMFTPGLSYVPVTVNDNYTTTFGAGTPGQQCYTSQTYTGTTAAVCASINTQRQTWYSCSGTSNFVPISAPSNGGKGYCVITSNQSVYQYLTIVGSPTSCPAGYVLNGSNCEIQNAEQTMEPSDGKPSFNIKFGGDGQPYFAPNPRDPDVADSVPPFAVTGVDQYGNPTSERITPNSQGGITIRRETQSVRPGTDTPVTQADVLTTNSFGTVTNVTSTTYDNTTITNVSNDIDTSMLAQQATLQQVKTLLDPQTAPDLTALDQPVTDARNNFINNINTAQTSLGTNPASTVNPAEYWTYASGTCYPIEWDAGRFGKISLERFCWMYDSYAKPLEIWILGVFGMLHSFRVWSGTVREV